MWVLHIVYAAFGLRFCDYPCSSVDSYKKTRERKKPTCAQLRIPFNFAVVEPILSCTSVLP